MELYYDEEYSTWMEDSTEGDYDSRFDGEVFGSSYNEEYANEVDEYGN